MAWLKLAETEKPLSDKAVKEMIPMFVDDTSPPDHKCTSCAMFIAGSQGCTIVVGSISGDKGSCNFWAKGPNAKEEDIHRARMDYATAGYVETPSANFPINCGSCKYFNVGIKDVTKGSCNLWQGTVKTAQCCMAYANSEVKAPQPISPVEV